MQTFTS